MAVRFERRFSGHGVVGPLVESRPTEETHYRVSSGKYSKFSYKL
jgi:hypothetical protein